MREVSHLASTQAQRAQPSVEFRHDLTIFRKHTPRQDWEAVAGEIARARFAHEKHLRVDLVDNWRGLLPSLEARSWVRLPALLDNSEQVRKHLLAKPVHIGPSFDTRGGTPVALETVAAPFACYRPDQILTAPGLLDQFNSPKLLDLIEAYMGCVPTLYSVNAWWTLPAASPEMVNVQYLHRDDDDWRFVVLFIYLTDVDESSGPHQIIPGSHSVAGLQKLACKDPDATFQDSMGVEFSQRAERELGGAAESIMGPAGTMFLANTTALHRGLVPTTNRRLIAWARYGLSPNTNSIDNFQGPLARSLLPLRLEDSPRLRRVNRLLVDFDG